MGIWDFISSTTEWVKRNTPGPVKQACTASYGYGSFAVGKIGDACGAIGVHRLNPGPYAADAETRAKIANFSTKFAKNAAVYALNEAYKSLPGAKAVSSIYSQTIRDMESENVVKHVSSSSEKTNTGGPVEKDMESGNVVKHVSSSSEKTNTGGPVEKDMVQGNGLDGLRKPEDMLMIVPGKGLALSRLLNELIIQDILSRRNTHKQPSNVMEIHVGHVADV